MQEYPELSILVHFESPGLVDDGFVSIFVVKINVAGRNRHCAVENDTGVLRLVSRPAFEGEAGIVLIFRISSDEVC